MPVPGLSPEIPLRAKVKIGVKISVMGQRERPASVDYFVCDDEEFERLAGVKPKTLLIEFPYASPQDCWSSGLEKWSANQHLLCYTKGDGRAHGLGAENNDGVVTLNPSRPRQTIACPAQNCNFYGKEPSQGCRPQARLSFLLVGGPRDGVYRFETKGLGSIERIEGVLSQYPDLRGIKFLLRVRKEKRGKKEFPVVAITESRGLLREAEEERSVVHPQVDQNQRREIKALLVARGQWPMNDAQVAWVNEVGIPDALRILRERAPRG